jgi:ribosome biogenesis GTPase
VLAANLDFLCIVAAAANPEFSPGLVDRFLIAAAMEKIQPVLCVNKLDLRTGTRSWDMYRDLGVEIFETSAKQAIGLDPIRARLSGKTGAFCGHSGVGKT